MVTIDELRRASTRPEATEPLCVNGALFGKHERLVHKLAEHIANAERLGTASLGGDEVREKLEQQLAELNEEMKPSTYGFTFTALDWQDFRVLEDAYPADPETGKSPVEFCRALVSNCLSDPPLSEDDLDSLHLSKGQFDKLWSAALRANQSTRLPFTEGSSPATPSSGPS